MGMRTYYAHLQDSVPANTGSWTGLHPQIWTVPAPQEQKMIFFKVYYLKTRSYGLSKKVRIGFISALLLACALVAVVLSVYFLYPWGNNKDFSPQVRNWLNQIEPTSSELGNYTHAAISTDSAPCAAIGRQFLERNGTAVDAAIATLLCMGVTIPHSMGLGGGCLMTIYNRTTGEMFTLDARETAPAAATEDMFHKNPNSSQIGGLSIAVPGELMGYWVAHETHGRLQWKDLFLPSIELCKKGFPVSHHLANALKQNRDIILEEQSLRSVFLNNETGDIYKENEILRRPDLAETLEILANEGPTVMYGNGKIGRKLVDDIKSFDGIITMEDLQSYSPVWREPIKVSLPNNLTLYSTDVPGSGAILAFMLNVMVGFNLSDEIGRDLSSTTLMYHRLVETFKFAYAKRMDLGDDDDSSEVKEVLSNLTSWSYADFIRASIRDNQTFNDPKHYGVKHLLSEDHGTAHVSVVDAEGNAVAVGTTVNLYLGSKRISPQTGIVLNDEMDDFSSPGIVNSFGLPPSKANFIRPGKRPMSSMCPTIIVNDITGDVVMTVGGNGGSHITSATASVILGSLRMGQTIKEAIDTPRLHHQLFPSHITYEKNFSEEILDGLRALGHKTEVLTGRPAIMLGIMRDKDGRLYANSDYRKGGKTDGY